MMMMMMMTMKMITTMMTTTTIKSFEAWLTIYTKFWGRNRRCGVYMRKLNLSILSTQYFGGMGKLALRRDRSFSVRCFTKFLSTKKNVVHETLR
jgi:hypothetical protein